MEPHSSRPHMPGYGISPAPDGDGLLPWSWAVDRLTRSHDYWVATVRPDGRPHVMPVWGVWLADAVWFSSAPTSRKARNIGEAAEVVVTTDDARQPVIVEGLAELVLDRTLVERFASASDAKYEVSYSTEFYAANATFRVTPRVVFGLDDDDFTGTPTRWSVPPT